MKTNMAGTSLEAWDSIQGSLQKSELMVLNLFSAGVQLTREQIALKLGKKEGAISGRVFALVNKHKILEEIDGGMSASQRKVKILRLADPQMRLV